MLSVWMLMLQAREALSTARWILWSGGLMVFAGSMLAACIMDMREQMVYRFLWLVGGLGAAVLMVLRVDGVGLTADVLIDLGVFVAIQQIWFARFYGRADCHAFCVSAFLMTALGMEFIDFVMHMLLAFAGLAIVQLVRRNVGRNGQLIKPVPMIPYISLALWLWVDFGGRKWYI